MAEETKTEKKRSRLIFRIISRMERKKKKISIFVMRSKGCLTIFSEREPEAVSVDPGMTGCGICLHMRS